MQQATSPTVVSLSGRCKGAVVLLLAATLLACSSTPVVESGGGTVENSAITRRGDTDTLQSLLQQGAAAPSPQKEQLLLRAAQLLRSQGRDEDAGLLLASLDTGSTPLPLAADILALRARLAADAGNESAALDLLTDARLQQLPQLPAASQMNIYLFRAELYNTLGHPLENAQARIMADQLVPAAMVPVNHEQIWKALTALEPDQLRNLSENERRFAFQGWYDLAVIGKAYQYNLDRQVVELARWRNAWTRHPAALYMPQALQLVETMARERPGKIALLLPLDTVPGRVIRNAFMSAYYDVMQIGGRVPELRFYNTADAVDVMPVYNQAVNDGAEMIIGPLLKQHVAQLHGERSLPVPTLALNNVEGSRPLSDRLYQFALSPENEAMQIADKAWQDGHRYAAILSPAVAADDFYRRKRNSFIDRWLALGGRIVTQAEFRDDYTGIVSSLLDIDDSEARKERLSDLIGKDLAFTQRRRRDIDFIFLIAEPGPARQIKPTLAYLYAGDIPVYASQDVYSGLPRPLEDNDLNGVVFGDSPWVLGFNDELKARASRLFPQSSALTLRLQAFGIDAFRLYPRLKQLETVQDSEIYGATGQLHLGENRNIVRQLRWATIAGGMAVAASPES